MIEAPKAAGDCPIDFPYPTPAVGLAALQYLVANRNELASNVPCAVHCGYAAIGALLALTPLGSGDSSPNVFLTIDDAVDAITASLANPNGLTSGEVERGALRAEALDWSQIDVGKILAAVYAVLGILLRK